MSGKEYTIGKELRSGKYGCSYVATAEPDGSAVFLKTPFIDLHERLEAQNDKNLRVFNSFTREYRHRYNLRDVDGVAHILDAGLSDFENRLITFLVQEMIEGEPLEAYLDRKYGLPTTGMFSGIPFQRDWIDLARRILEIMRKIHNRSVVHGDIWPPNILMVGDDPCLVDFGQSFILDEVPQEAAGRIKEHPYLAPERVTPGTRWDIPADIYSIGGLLFYMATGLPPPKPIENVEGLKEVVHAEIRARNPHLLKENIGIVKIIDKCLRFDLRDRYPYVENILDALDIFDYAHQAGTHSPKETAELVEDLGVALAKLSSSNGPSLFADLAVSELRVLRRQVDRMLRGHHEITAEREELINSLLRYLGVLDRGDEYLTITLPAFWRESNLGVNGRFLTMNRLMALKGVAIRRVFVLTEEDHDDPGVMSILQAHLRATEELQVDGVETRYKDLPAESERSYWTGYVLVSASEREDIVTSSQHVAIWRKPATDELVSITFSPRADGDEIGKVRFWRSPHLKSALDDFKSTLDASEHLAEFVNRGG